MTAPNETPAFAVPQRSHGLVASELVREHGALIRQLGALQRWVGDLLRTHADLQGHNIRLRAELVLLRSASYWGLDVVPRVPVRAVAAPMQTPWPEAQAVICRTGCVGHAHPWRDDAGQCRRTGQPCAPVELSEWERDP